LPLSTTPKLYHIVNWITTIYGIYVNTLDKNLPPVFFQIYTQGFKSDGCAS